MELNTILEVAEKCFYAKKYTDLKLDVIANELKIKKPTLYYYFPDKENLFIKTLEYSYQKYLDNLKKNIQKKSIEEFVIWSLNFPVEHKNLFAIALQKGYCESDNIRIKLFRGKQTVNDIVTDFLRKFGLSDIQVYLLLNLIEKLNQNNCIDSYCLTYKAKDLAKQIVDFLSYKD